MRHFFTFLISLLLPLSSMTLAAQEPPASPPSPNSVREDSRYQDYYNRMEGNAVPEDHNFFDELVHMLMVLGVIVAVMFFVAWLLKRVLNTRIQQMNESSDIKILERRSLTPKSSVYLIEVGGKGFVLGESQSGIERLGEVDISERKPFKEYMQEETQES